MVSDYTRWILEDDADGFDWDKVAYDGHGYVILMDGTRIDIKPDSYKSEREEWRSRKEQENKQQ